ncbi:MAG: 30S ribosomal protein S8 [Candidatus Wildermuthbacteria bacterium]|nr:30S ribosomal protein S8 [Candidatus Wildermuthbacteria bacterium]
MTSVIADMLNRTQNAIRVKHPAVDVSLSSLTREIARVMEEKGFIKGAEAKGKKERKVLTLTLKYVKGSSAITGARCVSKPGRRIYVATDEIFKAKGRRGIAILSTSKGIMADKEARESRVGGELLCIVW